MRIRRPIGYAAAAIALAVVLGGTVTSAVAILPASRAVCAEFTDTVGLYPGNDVTSMGVPVGRVTALQPQADRVRVQMTVDKGIGLPADVGAVTLSTSIVTDRHVELTKPYTGGPTLGDQCIPLERTKTPLGVSRALESMDQLTTALTGPTEPDGRSPGADLFGDTLRAADSAVSGTGEQFNQLLRHTSQLLRDPYTIDARMRRMIDNLDQLTGSFVTHWPDLQAVLDHLRDTLEMIEGVSNGLGNALAQANDLLPVLTRTIGKYDEQVYALLDKAVPFTHDVLSHAGDINDLLAHLPALGQELLALLTQQPGAAQVRYLPPQVEIATATTSQRIDLLSWLLGVAAR